jgi:hypothetical protein
MTMIKIVYASLMLTLDSRQRKAIWPEQEKYTRIFPALFLTIRSSSERSQT